MEISVPDAPYFFKTSAKYPGRAVESILFSDYGFIRAIYEKQLAHSSLNPNALQKHLDFVFAAEEVLTPKIICPFCREEPARKFMHVNSLFFDQRFIVCQSFDCLEKIRHDHERDPIFSLRPKTLASTYFRNSSLRVEASRLLKMAYGIITPHSGADYILALLKEALEYSQKTCI